MLRPVNISFDEDDSNHNNAIFLHDCFVKEDNNNDRLTAFDPGQPG